MIRSQLSLSVIRQTTNLNATVNCPVCSAELAQPSSNAGGDATSYDCPRCGRFILSGTLLGTLPHLLSDDATASAKLSHVIRRSSDSGSPAKLTTDLAEAIVKQTLPRPREQADLLLRWVAEHVPSLGETVWVDSRTQGAVIGSASWKGFRLVLDHLFATGLFEGVQSNTMGEAGAHATPSFAGWEHYENLRRGSTNYHRAFMAMKFGDPILDSQLSNVFKPSVRQVGFELFKLDDEPRAGLIDDRLRVEIQASDFVIADLTHDNLGAYWEAGYAEGLGKPVIYTCELTRFEAKKTHFDTNHHLTIVWDVDKPDETALKLKATVRATLPHLAAHEDLAP